MECWFSYLDTSSYPSWVLVLWLWVVSYCGVMLFSGSFFAAHFMGCFSVFVGWSLVSGFCYVFFVLFWIYCCFAPLLHGES